MARKPLIAGNWKMYKTIPEALELVSDLKRLVSRVRNVDVIIAPPCTALHAVVHKLDDSRIMVSAQNVHPAGEGAYTGEVSVAMLKDVGCSHVIIGHSERRQFFGDTDRFVADKVKATLKGGLIPILCVGETLSERENGRALDVVRNQMVMGMEPVAKEVAHSVVIAYEPVWAIGTGKTATPAQAQEMHAFIRGLVRDLYGAEVASEIRILYGGSVKPDNIDNLMAQGDIDGALVGGASLQAESFARIVNFSINE